MKNGQLTDIGNGIQIWSTDEGEGDKTLVFVHGLANYHGVWLKNTQELKNHFRCICIDLPGNGLSSKAEDRPYSLVFYAECVYRFMLAKGIENPVLVGHSMGGQIGLMLALRYPGFLSSLVLVAPSGLEYFTPTERVWMKQLMSLGSWINNDLGYLRSAILQSFYQKAEEQAAPILEDLTRLFAQHKGFHWGKMVRANINAMLDEPVHPFLNQLQVPVLVLFGLEDKLIPNKLVHPGLSIPEILRQADAMIPNCKTSSIEKAGHFVQWEKAHQVNQSIFEFLKRD
ncbi:alpha/beta hydrolase [Bacteroidota bacterium]